MPARVVLSPAGPWPPSAAGRAGAGPAAGQGCGFSRLRIGAAERGKQNGAGPTGPAPPRSADRSPWYASQEARHFW